MSGVRGILGGLLGLTLLDAALTSKAVTGGTSAIGGLFEGSAKVLDYWLARDQALIPWPCHGSSSSGPSDGSPGGLLKNGEKVGGGLIGLNPGEVISGAGGLGKGVWNDTIGQII